MVRIQVGPEWHLGACLQSVDARRLALHLHLGHSLDQTNGLKLHMPGAVGLGHRLVCHSASGLCVWLGGRGAPLSLEAAYSTSACSGLNIEAAVSAIQAQHQLISQHIRPVAGCQTADRGSVCCWRGTVGMHYTTTYITVCAMHAHVQSNPIHAHAVCSTHAHAPHHAKPILLQSRPLHFYVADISDWILHIIAFLAAHLSCHNALVSG